ncbi:MAG: GNAT family N-acetyltransferase [Candidatus Methanomethylophilaceae archaeon]|nr:GNAT family N-acetyltransferase [Candidatus Methanomethylophilaceae archaeon]
MTEEIRPMSLEHVGRYGEIYAEAFSGEPWNDPWRKEDASVHVRELLEMKTAYGLEYIIDGKIVGFILGGSMHFHYGRTFEINDLAVDPAHQRRSIASRLLERMLTDLEGMGIVGVHLLTAPEGALPEFYARYGFKKEFRIVPLGKELGNRYSQNRRKAARSGVKSKTGTQDQ